MTKLDRTQSSFIEQKSDRTGNRPVVGRVQQVFEHKKSDDYSNFEVDVKILGEDVQHRSIPLQQQSNGEVHVPMAGDKVMVEYEEGESQSPIARNIIYTNKDRPPVAKAGVWRKKLDAGSSPAGSGDLYVEAYTDYSVDPAKEQPSNSDANKSRVRIAKKTSDDAESDLPVSIEFVDDANGDASHVEVSLNKDDGSDSTETWGLKFDLKTGEFKMLDPEGFGIVSDGAGNFTWHHKTVDFSEDTTTSL